MVKNEGDIIESFVRHTLTFADMLIVSDHMSTDDTYEILLKLQADGLPIVLHRVYQFAQVQAEISNKMAHEAIDSYGADLVLLLDADEFLLTQDAENSCRDLLEMLSPEGIYTLLPLLQCEPMHPDVNRDVFLLNRPLKAERQLQMLRRMIIGGKNPDFAADKSYIVQGNHDVVCRDSGFSAETAHIKDRLYIAHFPWRSREQYQGKIMVSWPANAARYGRYTPYATHWKAAFDEVAGGRDGSAVVQLSEWRELNLSSQVADIKLQYTSAAPPDVMGKGMRAMEALAQQCAIEKALQRQMLVSVVLPYMGNRQDFQRTLRCLVEDMYPYKEVFILNLTDESLGNAAGVDTAEQENGCVDEAAISDDGIDNLLKTLRGGMTVKEIKVEDAQYATELKAQLQGDYVQWLLPWECFTPNKILEHVTYVIYNMYGANVSFVAASGETAPWGMEYGMREIWSKENIQPENMRKDELLTGKYLKGGISAGLYTRAMMEAVNYWERYWLNAAPLELNMLQSILTVLRTEDVEMPLLGHVAAEYFEAQNEVNINRLLLQKLEWFELLQAENILSPDEKLSALGAFRTVAEQLGAMSAQLSHSIYWEGYQAVCREILEHR